MARAQEVDFYQFRTLEVRDLAWAIVSPPVLSYPEKPGLWASQALCDQYYQTSVNLLEQLDRNPDALIQHLSQLRSKRLGERFEFLMSFFFAMHPDFSVISSNFPIRNQYRTLGEFDFIVQDTANNKTIHFEVAVKYYLNHGPRNKIESWLGPMPKDRLVDKRNKLEQQQSQLGRQPDAVTRLAENNIQIDETVIWLKGYLFDKQTQYQSPGQPAFEHENVQGLHGLWLFEKDFENWLTEQPAEFRWLAVSKPHYLAPRRYFELSANPGVEKLTSLVIHREQKYPVQIIGFTEDDECCRLFLVPDDWPESGSGL